MREAIEKVIAELEVHRPENILKDWNVAWNSATNLAINKLKEVLREHEPDPKGEQHTSEP